MELEAYGHNKISIHALREEGDRVTLEINGDFRISIHALREEGDSLIHAGLSFTCDFYPRPPRGGRHAAEVETTFSAISIHALREEGDSKNRDKISIFKQIIQHSARI